MRTKSKFGETIRNKRKDKGLSQEKLAELANVDPKTIIEIESGKRNPTLKTLQKLANVLKVSVDSLLKNS